MLGTLAVFEPHVNSNCLRWLAVKKFKENVEAGLWQTTGRCKRMCVVSKKIDHIACRLMAGNGFGGLVPDAYL